MRRNYFGSVENAQREDTTIAAVGTAPDIANKKAAGAVLAPQPAALI